MCLFVFADIGHYDLQGLTHLFGILEKIGHVQDFAAAQRKLHQSVDQLCRCRYGTDIRDLFIGIFAAADFDKCIVENSIGSCIGTFYRYFFHELSFLCLIRAA